MSHGPESGQTGLKVQVYVVYPFESNGTHSTFLEQMIVLGLRQCSYSLVFQASPALDYEKFMEFLANTWCSAGSCSDPDELLVYIICYWETHRDGQGVPACADSVALWPISSTQFLCSRLYDQTVERAVV
jgi:hypothetical protein